MIKPKLEKKFDSRVTKTITYIIYPILTIYINIKSFASLFIIKLENDYIILSLS